MKLIPLATAWWRRLTFPGQVAHQLAWRGQALNTILVVNILVDLPFAFRDAYSMFIAHDRCNLHNFIVLAIQGSVLWISKSGRIRAALLVECLYFTLFGILLISSGGVAHPSVIGVYLATMIVSGMLLQGAMFWLVAALLLGSYAGIGALQVAGRFVPTSGSDLFGHWITVIGFLVFLGLIGYIIERLVDQMFTKLQASEQKYRNIFEESHDMIFLAGIAGDIVDVNPACQTLLGYSVAEMKRLNARALSGQPGARERFRTLMAERGTVADFETLFRRKDGQTVPVSITATSRLAGDGTLIGYQGIVRDITAQQQAEQERMRALEFQAAKEAAEAAQKASEAAQKASEAANQAKSAFLANMSHELRTPLNAILGFTQLMARNPQFPPQEQEYLRIIRHSGDHLLTLINQVLDLSKIEAGHLTFNRSEVDVFRLLDDVELLFRLRAAEKQLQLVCTRADDVPRLILTDGVKVQQVLINLLSNALKFTSAGMVTLHARAAHNESDDPAHIRLSFEITDTGPGIPPEELDTLFEPFVQTHSGRTAQEGTGLGLVISRKFAQLLGGDIAIASAVGRGTCVTCTIQVGLVTETARSAVPAACRAIGLEPGQPRYKLLIVDDKPDNRTLLLKLFEPFGFDVRDAANAADAVAIWQQWRPHLIWMDLRMPGMSGYDAARAIRQAEDEQAADDRAATPASPSPALHTVIIALSASVLDAERAAALANGCDDFLRKPFREEEIFELLTTHLGTRFVYADIPQADECPTLTPEALTALPEEIRVELRRAVDSIDIETMHALLERIRPNHAALADALAELAATYRFDRLQTLLDNV